MPRKIKRGDNKKKFKKINILETIIFIIVLIAIYIAFLFFGKLNKIQRTEKLSDNDAGINQEIIDKNANKVERTGYETLVLYGVDSRQNQLDAGCNSDVIMIVGIDHNNKEIRIASVYRDTYMDNGENDKDGIILRKINSAYLYGYKRAIRALNRNLDLDIKNYATASFKAVTVAVDSVGGLKMNITDEEARQINRYVAETARVAGVKAHFLKKGGNVLLDGAQATTFARIRKRVGDDYSRANRQRIVIKKLFEKAKKSDFAQLNKLVDSVLPLISTNISNTEILSYITDIVTYDIVDTKAFPFELIDARANGASVLVPINLEKNVEELHKYLYPDQNDFKPSSFVKRVSNNIKNATGIGDAAQPLRIQYYNGEDANKIGNSENKNKLQGKEESTDTVDLKKQGQ